MNVFAFAVVPDGLTALRDVIQLGEIMRLIEQTARWVDPETFRLLPLWYPEHARKTHFFKKNWSEPQMNKNKQTGISEHKREANLYANTLATKFGKLWLTGKSKNDCT